MGAPQPSTVRVLTVDDQEVFRRAARDLIAAAEGFEQIAEAASGEECLRVARDVHPDLVLLDVRMPGLSGVETARRLRREVPEATVVLMSLEELPAAAGSVDATVGHVRKQELSVRKLRDLWQAHGRRPAAAAGAAPAEPSPGPSP